MRVDEGRGTTVYGPGVDIFLEGSEVALAIDSWLVGQNIHIEGPRTITVNGKLIEEAKVYVDHSGAVFTKSKKISGRGK